MTSLIAATVARIMTPIFLLFSLFLLLRGHQAPGGGFTGGLMAATAFAVYLLAYGVAATRRLLGVESRALIGAGLLIAASSAIWPLCMNQPLLTGQWIALPAPLLGGVHLGTPLLFDLGVYLVVVGALLTIMLSLAEE